MRIDAKDMHFKTLNEYVRESKDKDITIDNCNGQRYIGAGLKDKNITINGTPGNALGAYLDGANIVVNGNAQDATGDTMNEGIICIHGYSGDATGYGMRGGKILIRENAGYRAGIHMKAYESKLPVLVIGGKAGSFLGEYQAGGLIIVLDLKGTDNTPAGYFCGTGMHGGKIYLRCDKITMDFPKQVLVNKAEKKDLAEIEEHIADFCAAFGGNKEEILNSDFYVLTPNTKNPYRQLYTHN